MDYDSLLEVVKKRRSIRRFKPDPVPQEDIERIIEVKESKVRYGEGSRR